MNNRGFDKKKIGIIAGVLGAIVVAIIGITVGHVIWDKTNSATIDLLVTPSNAKVYVDGAERKAGTMRMKPGDYEIMAAMDGFEPETKQITVKDGETQNVFMVLVPNTPETMNWYLEHPEDASIADGSVSMEYSAQVEEALSKYNIMTHLPFVMLAYSVGYGNCTESGGPEFCLVIKADFGYREGAIQYLQRNSDDIGRYYIDILNYKDPFLAYDINVPSGLRYDGESENITISDTDFDAIEGVVNERIARLSDPGAYGAELMQTKVYSGNYAGATVKVYEVGGEESNFYDLYRMLLAKVDGEWRIIADLDFLLNYDDNPSVPTKLIDAINSL